MLYSLSCILHMLHSLYHILKFRNIHDIALITCITSISLYQLYHNQKYIYLYYACYGELSFLMEKGLFGMIQWIRQDLFPLDQNEDPEYFGFHNYGGCKDFLHRQRGLTENGRHYLIFSLFIQIPYFTYAIYNIYIFFT